jgi:hypothetical protein
MKRPSFQFYPADWRNNAKLRRCSEAARGAWIDVLCLMHDSDEYGVLRWPLADIARAAGLPIKLLKELVERDVLKGGDKGCEAYIHTPVHARKKGAPVTLLEKTDSSCWYSSRFLTDEWRRSVSGGDTKFKSPKDTPEDSPSGGKVKGEVKENDAPEYSPDDALGAGATSSSTSSTTLSNSESNCNLAEKNKNITPTQKLVGEVMQALKEIRFMPFNPDLPEFIALIEAGATPEEFANTAMEFKGTDKFKPSYLLSTMIGRRQDAAKLKLHKGPMPAATNREAGRQVAAASVFTAENTQHLQGNTLKIVEVDYDQRAIAN